MLYFAVVFLILNTPGKKTPSCQGHWEGNTFIHISRDTGKEKPSNHGHWEGNNFTVTLGRILKHFHIRDTGKLTPSFI
jgi:hypothetical protein